MCFNYLNSRTSYSSLNTGINILLRSRLWWRQSQRLSQLLRCFLFQISAIWSWRGRAGGGPWWIFINLLIATSDPLKRRQCSRGQPASKTDRIESKLSVASTQCSSSTQPAQSLETERCRKSTCLTIMSHVTVTAPPAHAEVRDAEGTWTLFMKCLIRSTFAGSLVD